MKGGWRYRLLAVGGAITLTAFVVAIANTPPAQSLLTSLPILWNLEANTYGNSALVDEILMTLVIVLGALWPLFKPKPRRILDVISLTHKRIFLATTGLATIGYFDWSARLPRTTLIITGSLLMLLLPIWFVSIRQRPQVSTRAVIVGDDFEAMKTIRDAADQTLLGFVAPTSIGEMKDRSTPEPLADGGESNISPLPRLGGLSRLDEVLIEHEVDTVLLGFSKPDREEFFGALAACHEYGIRAQVHRNHADNVLVAEATGGDLVDTDLEPWDWQDHMIKRLFDIVFAAASLLFMLPLILIIGIAIKLDSAGPILYSQRRTAEFGEMFPVYKFRTMTAGSEDSTPVEDSANDQITPVGRLLRKTHLDEIPQLWTILTGQMSVVGPRAAWTDEEYHLEESVSEWRKRWFVKPGLTGLAQINNISSTEPERKVRYDIEYIRKQSFWFDLKIVTRQVYQVVIDAVGLLTGLRQ